MHEDILSGNYSDPMEMDNFAIDKVNEFGENVEKLANNLLTESELKFYKKKKANLEDLYEDEAEEQEEKMKDQYPAKRHYRRVDGTNPWDVKTTKDGIIDDQSFYWPDYEAESFEAALDEFRQRPESNTGYDNEALNKKMQDRWSKQVIDDIVYR